MRNLLISFVLFGLLAFPIFGATAPSGNCNQGDVILIQGIPESVVDINFYYSDDVFGNGQMTVFVLLNNFGEASITSPFDIAFVYSADADITVMRMDFTGGRRGVTPREGDNR